MKPRLGSQQLTIEDWEAWTLVQMRFAQVHHLQRFSFDADRRDADLMLGIARGRNLRIDHPGDPSGDFSAVVFSDDGPTDWVRG